MAQIWARTTYYNWQTGAKQEFFFGNLFECNYYIRFFECFLRIRFMGSVIQSRFHWKKYHNQMMCGYINGSCMSIFPPYADRSPNKNTPDASLLIQCCYNTILKRETVSTTTSLVQLSVPMTLMSHFFFRESKTLITTTVDSNNLRLWIGYFQWIKIFSTTGVVWFLKEWTRFALVNQTYISYNSFVIIFYYDIISSFGNEITFLYLKYSSNLLDDFLMNH